MLWPLYVDGMLLSGELLAHRPVGLTAGENRNEAGGEGDATDRNATDHCWDERDGASPDSGSCIRDPFRPSRYLGSCGSI